MIRKQDVEKLITHHKKCTAYEVWKDMNRFDIKNYSGELRTNEILLWRPEHRSRSIAPIFHLSFNTDNILAKIEIHKNPYRKFINYLLLSFSLLFILFLFIYEDTKIALIVIVSYAVIALLLYLILKVETKDKKQHIIDEFKMDIQEVVIENNPDINEAFLPERIPEKINEWSLKNMSLRILSYPFCFFLIALSYLFFEDGMLLHGVILIGVCLSYLITDIILLFKKRNNQSS